MTPLALSTLATIAIVWAALLVLILVPLLLYGERRHERDRRSGPSDRRRGLPDTRAEPVERRTEPADRRSGRSDRRAAPEPGARRRLPRLPRRRR